MGAHAARQLVRSQRIAPTQAGARKAGRCTSAPMRATDTISGVSIFRGVPEQLTFGATEEEGIAVSPDGRTLVTSAGIRESTV